MSFEGFLFLALEAISADRNPFSNFVRGSPKYIFCSNILKSKPWPTRTCHLKVFLFLAVTAILFSHFSSIDRRSPNRSVKLF